MVSFARILFIIIVALLAGCGATKQARSVETSGFLGDLYPLMHKGEKGEALLLYKNPKVAMIPRGTYKKMLLDHAQIWGPPTTDVTRQKNAQHVADILYGLAYGMAEGTQRALVADFAPKETKATVIGAYHTCVGLVKLASGIVAGFLWVAVAPQATFAFGAVGATVAALALVAWRVPATS